MNFQALFSFILLGVVINNGRATTVRKIIHTDDAPAPTLPYSQAVQVGDIVYVSGTVGSYLSGELAEGITNQTRQSLDNIGHILKAGNSGFCSVVKVTVLLADMAYYEPMNEVYAEYFLDKFPARMACQIARLPRDALVEIDVIAISGEIIDV